MTVRELKEILDEFPEDALVMVKHELIGDEHYVEDVTYKERDYHDETHGVVWIREMFDY